MGPITVQPTFIYLTGEQEVLNRNGVLNDVDIRTFIADTIVGFRTGPLNVETRIMYTPGQDANQDIQNGAGGTIRTYQPINPGFAYMNGWTEIWTGGIDYASSFLVGRSALTLRESPSYDKYGRIFWGLAADYSLTPALTFRAMTNVSWTDKKVDTKGTFAAATTGITPSTNPFNVGKERYLGNEWVLGLTYRFAPNIAFDFAAAALIVGDALNIQRTGGNGNNACITSGVPTCEAQNVYKGSARLRVTF
jgi:hypothetical protein